MEVTGYTGDPGRQVLAGMIASDTVLSRIASKWPQGAFESGLFAGEHINLIAGWCVDFHREHNQAPGSQIQNIFGAWAAKPNADPERVETVKNLLQICSDESRVGGIHEDYVLGVAADLFNATRAKQMAQEALVSLSEGADKGQALIDRLKAAEKIDFSEADYAAPRTDPSCWDGVFDQDTRESLITLDGDVGGFFAGTLRRGELYAFTGPDKTGKTTYLVDMAYNAIRQRRRVAFFGAGDEDLEGILIRFAVRGTGLPEVPGEIVWPTGWADGPDSELLTVKSDKPATNQALATRAYKRIGRSKDAFRVTAYPNDTLTVDEIDSTLRSWRWGGYSPDVVVIDYADILADPPNTRDGNDAIDRTWKHLRRLAAEWDCLVLTATQSNAAAYAGANNEAFLTKANFSGRKTKMAHVHGMIGINVTDAERDQHMTRLNWIARRKWLSRSRHYRYVRTAGCFDLERPIIQSIR